MQSSSKKLVPKLPVHIKHVQKYHRDPWEETSTKRGSCTCICLVKNKKRNTASSVLQDINRPWIRSFQRDIQNLC